MRVLFADTASFYFGFFRPFLLPRAIKLRTDALNTRWKRVGEGTLS